MKRFSPSFVSIFQSTQQDPPPSEQAGRTEARGGGKGTGGTKTTRRKLHPCVDFIVQHYGLYPPSCCACTSPITHLRIRDRGACLGNTRRFASIWAMLSQQLVIQKTADRQSLCFPHPCSGISGPTTVTTLLFGGWPRSSSPQALAGI